jgi:hypothetical protein
MLALFMKTKFKASVLGAVLLILGVWHGLAQANVTLDSFALQFKNNAIEVKWATGSELDVAAFILYRSTGSSTDFVEVNRQDPKGDTVGASYLYIDTAITPGTTYTYRLVEIETAGAKNTLKEQQVVAVLATATAAKTATLVKTNTLAASATVQPTNTALPSATATAFPSATTSGGVSAPSATPTLTQTAMTSGGNVNNDVTPAAGATQAAAQTQLAVNLTQTPTPQPTFTSVPTQTPVTVVASNGSISTATPVALANLPATPLPDATGVVSGGSFIGSRGNSAGGFVMPTVALASSNGSVVSATALPATAAALGLLPPTALPTPPAYDSPAGRSSALDGATSASGLGGFFVPVATIDPAANPSGLLSAAPTSDPAATPSDLLNAAPTSDPAIGSGGGSGEPAPVDPVATPVGFSENLPNTGGAADAVAPTLDWQKLSDNTIATPASAQEGVPGNLRLSGSLDVQTPTAPVKPTPVAVSWLRPTILGAIIFSCLLAIEFALLTIWLLYRKYHRTR